MDIWLLSHLKNSPGNEIFLDAAIARGHRANLVDPRQCSIEKENLPDIVFARMGASAPIETLQTIDELEALNVKVVNPAPPLRLARDKALSSKRLVEFGIPVPRTTCISTSSILENNCKELFAPPWVVKLPVSTKGEGVFLVNTSEALVEMCQKLTGNLVVQEYIHEARGRDTRVLVLNRKAIAAIERVNNTGEFRSNVHQGAVARAAELTPELKDLAQQSANALGLLVAGVDILRSKRGGLVIEVNGSPGLKSHIECKQNVTDEIITFLELFAQEETKLT